MPSHVDVSSLSSLTTELKRRGVETRTPGLKADERHRALTQRYIAHEQETNPRFIPPPPMHPQKRSLSEWIPPPPSDSTRIKSGIHNIPAPPRTQLNRSSMSTATTNTSTTKAPAKGYSLTERESPWNVPPKLSSTKRHTPPVGHYSSTAPLLRSSSISASTDMNNTQVSQALSDEFGCEECGKKFKKVAHLIVHSRTHKKTMKKTIQQASEASIEENNSQGVRSVDESKDRLWIEEFAKTLYDLARTESQREDGEGQKESKLERRNTISGAIARRPGEPGFVPPPPKGPPPPSLMRSSSMPNLFVSSNLEKVQREHQARQELEEMERKIEAARGEVAEMANRKDRALRSRLQENKEVEMQELEWELEQVQAELVRVEQHAGVFIDSRMASKNGRVQRWAKEELAQKLIHLEAQLSHRLRLEVGKIRREEDENPEYGVEAQRIRRSKLAQLEKQFASLQQSQQSSEREFLGGKSFERDGMPPEVMAQEALMLHMKHKRPQEAEELYRKALELKPDDATIQGNFALFLSQRWTSREGLQSDMEPKSPVQSRSRDEEADKCFRASIKLDPSNANNLSNYALFLKNNLKEYDRAEPYFERACRADPQNAGNLGNFATFLSNIRKDPSRADRMFRRALEINPNHVNNLCSYAGMLKRLGKVDHAEELYRRALGLEPKNATVLSNYGNLLAKMSDPDDLRPENMQRLHKAQELYLQALSVDRNHRSARRNYMIFLRDFPSMRTKEHERSFRTKSSRRLRRSHSPRSPRSASRKSPEPPNLSNIIE